MDLAVGEIDSLRKEMSMLQLKDIRKNYEEGDHVVRALRGISLQFRKSEFVSILGPSGCGKTTLLNIIGGLDRYTQGDLVIGGKSTKDFKDRDWDAYRNYTVGFVFQSYHLIPHQSVLQNVELALTLSGVPRQERRRRAKEALEQVGLGDQLRKRPGQMSGGQMQRVAIARALVNNPEIILADEPTGALDTETSQQVMEILKEISKERLVIMVTHNPELARQYSTRIINMLDGEVTHDSNPPTPEELPAFTGEGIRKKGRKKLPSMSFATAFLLSLKNLFTKKGRTALTAFAGSIGIIGIALIFAISQGTNTYISSVQEDTLTAYPLTLEATTVDLGMLIETFMGGGSQDEAATGEDGVYSQSRLFDMINALNNLETTENDLKSFNQYLHDTIKADPDGALRQAITGIQYTYNLDLQVYTKTENGEVLISDTQELLMEAIRENMGMDMSGMLEMRDTMSAAFGASIPQGGGMNLWTQMLSGMDGEMISPVLKNQYELLSGSWPDAYDEIVLVVDENHRLDDLTLYALGLITREEINEIFSAAAEGEMVDTTAQHWSYEELLGREFRVVLSSDCYIVDEDTGAYMDLRLTDAGLRYLYDNGISLKISGILCPKEDASTTMLSGAIGYTEALTEHIIAHSGDSPVIQAQMENPEKDILTGLPFREESGTLTEAQMADLFRERVAAMDTQEKAQTYIKIQSTPTYVQLEEMITAQMEGVNREQMQNALVEAMQQQMSMSADELMGYVEAMEDTELVELYRNLVEQQIRLSMAAQAQQQLTGVEPEQLAQLLDGSVDSYTQEQCAQYYEEVLSFSQSTYEENLTKLGYVELDDPSGIHLYASSFENKDVIEEAIAQYNSGVDELKQIHYTDYVGLIMQSVTTIIDAITYVLVAFVSISLVVSSIMIGVITLISVQERTREIGILRAIGASKRNVSSMFNAETVIIGFISGVLGVGVTCLLCIPINVLIGKLTNIAGLRVYLPWQVGAILIAISVGLTLLAGIIPSRSAARKDPVVALRTE